MDRVIRTDRLIYGMVWLGAVTGLSWAYLGFYGGGIDEGESQGQ